MAPKQESLDAIIMAITDLTNAVTYLSNVIGHKADDQNPPLADGTAAVKIDTAFKKEVLPGNPPEEKKPEVKAVVEEKPEPVKPAITYNQGHVKHALNALAKAGKMDAALKLIQKYAGSNSVTDLKEADYAALIEEAKHVIK